MEVWTTIGVLVRGLLIGISIAAPVGPIGVLCIRRTLADGWRGGFATGMGAATADALYGCVAAFGLGVVTTLLAGQLFWIRLVGGLFLCYLGLRTAWTRPAERPATAAGRGLLAAYGATLLLTLTNPATILSFVAIFAGLGLGGNNGTTAAVLLVLGVFSGSALWWLLLSAGVSLLRGRIGASALRWINKASGAVIIAFGLAALLSLAA